MTKPVCAQLGYQDFFGDNNIDYSVYGVYTGLHISNRNGARGKSQWCRKISHSE